MLSAGVRTVGAVTDPVGDVPAGLVAEYQRLATQVAAQRERAASLRMLADHAEAQADRDERMLGEVASVAGFSAQLRIEDVDPRLRGPRLERVAIELLMGRDGDDAIHYRDWFSLLRAAGYHVSGKDPLATFLTQINRAEAVERVGQRTGMYRLRAVA
jgi:hypothetical protein